MIKEEPEPEWQSVKIKLEPELNENNDTEDCFAGSSDEVGLNASDQCSTVPKGIDLNLMKDSLSESEFTSSIYIPDVILQIKEENIQEEDSFEGVVYCDTSQENDIQKAPSLALEANLMLSRDGSNVKFEGGSRDSNIREERTSHFDFTEIDEKPKIPGLGHCDTAHESDVQKVSSIAIEANLMLSRNGSNVKSEDGSVDVNTLEERASPFDFTEIDRKPKISDTSSAFGEPSTSYLDTKPYEFIACSSIIRSEVEADGNSDSECDPISAQTQKEEVFVTRLCSTSSESELNQLYHNDTSHADTGASSKENLQKMLNSKEYLQQLELKHSGERRYSCEHCLAQFVSKSVLRRHMTAHSDERPFSCQQCSRTFKLKQELTSHSITHSDEKLFSCEQCSKSFKSKQYLKVHLRTHTEERPFSCDQCSRTFRLKQELNYHSRTHSEERPFSCEQCSRTFKVKQQLNSHLSTHSNEKPFSCERCSKTYKSKQKLQLHLRTHSENRPFSCKQCSRTFKSKQELNSHLLLHSDATPFSCEQCSARFKRKMSLKRHAQSHSNERPFRCEHCSAQFKSEHELTRHTGSHSNATPFSCVLCTAQFKCRRDRYHHMFAHRDESEKRRISCDQCTAIFSHIHRLNQHVREKHINEKPYSCELCPAKFKYKSMVKKHLTSHSEDRPFSCDLCSAQFKVKKSLDNHLSITHLTERPFTCEKCSLNFKSEYLASMHELYYHSNGMSSTSQ